MIRRSLIRMITGLFFLGFGTQAAAQLSIARPKPTSIQQASATLPSLTEQQALHRPQIRMTIRYLMVDEATRSKIYATIPADTISTHAQMPPSPAADERTKDRNEEDPLVLSETVVASSKYRFRVPTRITSCELDKSLSRTIIEMAANDRLCEVSDAPSVILNDGKEAEMNDVVQHPMVVDVKAVGDVIAPTVEVFEDGIRFRMKASLGGLRTPREGFLLSCEVTTSETIAIKTHQIYGVEEEPIVVQVPMHLITSSVASARITTGHTLMIDPHHSRETTPTPKQDTSILTKIPYLGRNFKSVTGEPVERWMIVLLEPTIEPSYRGQR
ncbi:MAG: hypothetical protein P1U77_04685 [Rubripirellula sp.]|jgi:hypothetical protein|nr:hypothetical protein [Planctomycetaceae bacterium]MDF1840706.1 hypothetical protein [Rubripirellula sp.]